MRAARPGGLGSPRQRRPVLLVAIVVTLGVLFAGLAGLPGVGRVRHVGAALLGPLERLLAPDPDGEVAAARAERDRFADLARQAQQQAQDRTDLTALLTAPTTNGATVVPAHIVGLGRAGAGGLERLTLDVGSRDGISVDTTVVSAGGLVGRVVSTAPWTSDVVVLGNPDVVVGVRVGPKGLIGTVSATAGATTLHLELVQQGDLAVGDVVTTLGSVHGRPFVAGVEVGRVSTVEPLRGRATTHAVVTPAVHPGELRLVGVLLTAPRVEPRPAATGSAP